MPNSNTSNGIEPTLPPPPHRHVAVCAFPFGGHATALLNLVRRMATSATHVIFTFINLESSNAAVFTNGNFSLSNIVPCRLPGGEKYAGMNHMEAFICFSADAPVAFRRAVAAAEAEVGAEVSCVVGDAFLWYCGEIAEEKGVPWFLVWAPGPASLACHLYTDILRKRFSDVQERMDEKVGDCVPVLSNIHFGDIPSEVIQDFESPIGKIFYNMAQALPKATSVIIDCFYEVAPIVINDLKLKMNVFTLGPFSSLPLPQVEINDEYGCIPWLDHHNKAQSVVYIAFGTFSIPPPDEIMALAEALGDIKVPFIWSMSDKIKTQLPSSFLQWVNENQMIGKIVPWAPQKWILGDPRVGVFITHCGWGSLLESISSAKPMICRSITADQMLNQRYVEDELRFGVGVEGGVFTKGSVVKALQQTLFGEVGVQLRENALMLKKIVNEITKEGGRLEKDFNVFMELVIRERT